MEFGTRFHLKGLKSSKYRFYGISQKSHKKGHMRGNIGFGKLKRKYISQG